MPGLLVSRPHTKENSVDAVTPISSSGEGPLSF